MIWWQKECRTGDMIRISFGNFYHYGIFVSEEEVIQFGLPPTEGLLSRDFNEISVCVSDIEVFSSGKIVEVAQIEKGDKLKRLPPKKTVALARSRIGERGYDILHNNCEHFAKFCYLGEKGCEVTKNVADSWNKKSKFDIYFSKIPEDIILAELYPEERNCEIEKVSNEKLKVEKYWAWKTLEYALFRSFGFKMENLHFTKNKYGKWLCKECFFSISHSDGYVAVALSNVEVGIDIENINVFLEKAEDEEFFEKMAGHILKKGHGASLEPLDLLKTWTGKESSYKCCGKKGFNPAKTEVAKNTKSLKFTLDNTEFLCSITGEGAEKSFFYTFDGKETSKFKETIWI